MSEKTRLVSFPHYSLLRTFIAGGDDVTFMLRYSLRDAIVGVGSLVHAGKSLKPYQNGKPDKTIFFVVYYTNYF